MQHLPHSDGSMLNPRAQKTLDFFREYISDEKELAQLNEILFTHQGCDSQICGKVFNEGDLVYHCATCAYDESCVLCGDCFEDEQHRGHEVTFSQSSGNGGCCDCGDLESWKDPQIDSCKHRKRNEKEKIEILPSLLLCLKPAILDIFKCIISALNLSESAEDEQENAEWAVMLYNDEMHSFDQVISTMISALDVETSEAEGIAQTVDEIGIVCCFCSEFQEEAQEIARRISKSKLFTRVIPFKRYVREDFAFDLLGALLRLSRFHEIRILICNLLMSPFASLFSNLQNVDDNSSLPEGLFSFQKPKIQDLLLIDYLLIYEHLGWKSFREHFHQFLITCPFAECETFKIAVSERFCFVYSCIYEIYQKEREPEISIINFSTQIFTGPKIALHLTLNTSILKVLIGILRTLFSGTLSNSSLTVNTQHRSLKNRRFYQLLNDFHLLVSHQTVQEAFPSQLKEPILQILGFFEGFSPETRAVNEHVQFENSSWIYAFNISLRIAPLIWHLSKCFSPADIPLILQTYQNIPQISQRNYSFYHPFHWLLGAIIHRETENHADSTAATTTIFSQFPQASKILIAHSLGLQFMIAEIQSNLWIRNGSSIYQQAYAYFGSDLYEFMWAQDWNLCKFFSQKTTLIPKIEFAFENASHLQEILVLICRLISQVDHNSPRMILLHALGEGPVKLSELTERLPDCLKNHQKLFNSLLEELSMRKGKKFQLKPCFLSQIDVFHLAVKTKKHQTDIVHHCKDNSVDVYLNDVPSDSSGCVNLLSALEERIQTVSSDWIRECSNEICALAWRLRNQIPNFFHQLVPKLPQDSPTVQKVFSCFVTLAAVNSSQNSLLAQQREEKPKKKRALEFQQAILQQMQQAQKFFLEAEPDYSVQTSSSKPSSPSESSSHKCMICQEELTSKPFGFWSKREKMNFSKFSPLCFLSLKPQASEGYFYSTCGHCIHLDCNDSFTQFSNYLKSEIDPITGIEEEFQLYTCPVCKRIGNVVIPSLQEEELDHDSLLESAAFRSFKGVLFEKNSSTMEDIFTSIRMQFIVAELLERIQGQGDYKFDQGPDSRILIPMIKYVEKNGIPNVLQRLQEEFQASPIYSMLFFRFIEQNQAFFPNFTPIPIAINSSLSIENQVKEAGLPFLMPLEARLDQMIARLSGLKCLNCSINHSDYAICLMCEQICCPKKLCCADGPFGECVQHRASQACEFDTVAFFWPKKCKILVISKGCGSFYPAPYVDETWGETFALGKRIIRHLDRPKYLGFCRKWLMGELANLGCVDGEAVPLGPDWYTY